jgi:PAS domain S-box-containing protein
MAEEDKTPRKDLADAARPSVDAGGANERRLRLALEAARLGTWEIDLRTNMGIQDPRSAEIFGLPLEQTQADPASWRARIHPDDLAYVSTSLEQAIQGAAEYKTQFRVVRPDGTVRWVDASARVDRNEAGQPVRVYGVAEDITDKKQAEQSLRESEEKYRSIFETAGNLITAVNRDGILVDCNGRIETLLGYRREEVVGQSISKFIHPEDLPAALVDIFDGGRSHRDEYRMVRKDGQVIHVSISSSPLKDSSGKCMRTTCIVEDITAQRRIVADLRKRDEQLRTLNATLEQRIEERTAVAELRANQLRLLAGQLTQAEQQERRRVAHILHEHFQQLLVGARLNLSTLRAGLADAGLLASVRDVDAALDEAIETSRSLTVELSPPILYDAGLAEVLAWLGRWMKERHGLDVRVQADPIADPPAEDVRIALFVAARELLLNVARHAGVKNATVSMNLGDDRRTRIAVVDAGTGFDPSQVAQAMKGFGLFGIRERLEMLGGRLEIQSAPGQGTRAMLLGPLPPAKPIRSAVAEGAATETKVRILVADDHAIVRDGLVSLLQGFPDMDVVGQASDGQAAVDMAWRLQPDVVIMDVSMSRMNGIEATRRIREQIPQIRVIGLSMHAEADMAEQMRLAGAETYLTKSGPPDDLIAAIRARATNPDTSASE